jgi:hypothetical protein
MKRAFVSMLYTLLIAIVCWFPLVVGGQELSASSPSKGAEALAKKYLATIDKTALFPAAEGSGRDAIFVGQSLNPPRGWRIIAVADRGRPRVVWDSFTFHDTYLDVAGLSSINAEADGHNGYILTWRGCVPHQCSDGRIGFALYTSQNHQTYRAHVSTSDDNLYHVVYYPQSGIPDEYRKKLDEMMCSDDGISRPSALPIKCSAR